ncbi:MAG TPA: hypothetical protein VES88_18280 [Gemmatimonadaceae bacterium]|nr:hypothetical protein [Gemmatimonadaceae bacterium]
MHMRSFSTFMAVLALAGTAVPMVEVSAQNEKKKKVARSQRAPRDPGEFFKSEQPITITLTTNLARIRKDKGEKKPWRAGTVKYVDPAGKEYIIPVELRTRGIWRLKNCEIPPMRMNFARATSVGTPFWGLDLPKLTSVCRDDDAYEQYILQELQLYRVQNLLTPVSHKARLMNITYVDSVNGKVFAKRSAIMLEEPLAMAQRLGGMEVKLKGATGDDLDPFHNAFAGVFQYFIGNTDWSIAGLHNMELLSQTDGTVIPIPWDYDFSGAINARYATTDPSLTINRVRDRLYRGYCGPAEKVHEVVALFKGKKDAIYALYTDEIGQMMKPNTVKETLQYFDDFYKTIKDPRGVERNLVDECLGRR